MSVLDKIHNFPATVTRTVRGIQRYKENQAEYINKMSWKCDVCLVTNDEDAGVCVCCEYSRDKKNPNSNNGIESKSSVIFNANLKPSDSRSPFTFAASSHNSEFGFGVENPADSYTGNESLASRQVNPLPLNSCVSGFVPKLDNFELTPSTPISTPLLKIMDNKEEECKSYYENYRDILVKYKDLVKVRPSKIDTENDAELKLPLGSVWVWGSGECDQLGIRESLLDEDLSLKSPMEISDLSKEHNIIDISSGALHNIVLTDKGELFSWGCNDDGALGRLSKRTCEGKTPENETESGADEEDTETYETDNDCAENEGSFSEKYPNKITFSDGNGETDVKVTSIVSGDCYSCCLTEKGEIYIWGSYKDSGGYIGFPNYDTMSGSIIGYKQYRPVKIPIFGEKRNESNKRRKTVKSKAKGNLECVGKVRKVVGGENHTIVITESNRIFAWGSTEFGQFGVEPVVDNKDCASEMNKVEYLYPVELTNEILGFDSDIEIQDVFCGRASTFFVVHNEKINKVQVYSCGRNGRNELGVFDNNCNSACDPIVPKPKKVSIRDFDPVCKRCISSKPIRKIGGGQYYSALLTCCGNVYTWGMKECCGLEMCRIKNRELNDNNINDRDIKTPTIIDHLKEIEYLGFGADNCFAIDRNGLIFSWGLNLTGQVGIKELENAEVVMNPYLINPNSFSKNSAKSVNYALKVTGGSQHSIALIWNGLYCNKNACSISSVSEDTSLAQDMNSSVTDASVEHSSVKTQLKRMNARSFSEFAERSGKRSKTEKENDGKTDNSNKTDEDANNTSKVGTNKSTRSSRSVPPTRAKKKEAVIKTIIKEGKTKPAKDSGDKKPKVNRKKTASTVKSKTEDKRAPSACKPEEYTASKSGTTRKMRAGAASKSTSSSKSKTKASKDHKDEKKIEIDKTSAKTSVRKSGQSNKPIRGKPAGDKTHLKTEKTPDGKKNKTKAKDKIQNESKRSRPK